jgi:hypothetical protein
VGAGPGLAISVVVLATNLTEDDTDPRISRPSSRPASADAIADVDREVGFAASDLERSFFERSAAMDTSPSMAIDDSVPAVVHGRWWRYLVIAALVVALVALEQRRDERGRGGAMAAPSTAAQARREAAAVAPDIEAQPVPEARPARPGAAVTPATIAREPAAAATGKGRGATKIAKVRHRRRGHARSGRPRAAR